MRTTTTHLFPRAPALATLLVWSMTSTLPVAASPDPTPQLSRYYDDWLTSVGAMISDVERQVFLGLPDDRSRELFIHRFWRGRPGDAGSFKAPLERWRQNFEEVRRRFRDLASDRAQALMVAGKPARVLGFGGCGRAVRQLEIWSYTAWQAEHLTGEDGAGEFHLVFYQPSRRQIQRFELWRPEDGVKVLMLTHGASRKGWEPRLEDLLSAELANPCVPATHQELQSVCTALKNAWSGDELRRRLAFADPVPGRADVGGPHLPGTLEISYLGHYRRHYTLTRGRIRVPAAAIKRNAEGLLFDRLVIAGDLYREGIFVDAFRVVHHVAGQPGGEAGEDTAVALDFYRRLRRGRYELKLRLEDGSGLALLREDRWLDVPWVEAVAVPPAGFRLGFDGLVREEVGILQTFPSVRLEVAEDEALAGEVEVAAHTTGGPIGWIDFLLDGESVTIDEEPPYAAVLTLAAAPERRQLEAVAFDAEGREIARDHAVLNAAPPRFAVRLAEPRRGTAGPRARAVVDVPLGEELERLDFHLGGERFATLFEAPFVYPIPSPLPAGEPFLRAVARLRSGAEAEDVVFLGDEPLEEVDVDLVELFTSVTGPGGRNVLGLAEIEFRVFEDGEPRTIERFDTVESLPIRVVLLMDVSKSMRHRMEIATTSAHRFFDSVLTPKDQAAVLVFNHDIVLVAPFTNDAESLRYETSGLSPWGSTRLHDSLVYALHYFGGQSGKKALVLLSDGQDVDSDFYFRQVLVFALRSGVAAYPIVLDLPHEETRANLEELAAKTGGRFFSIGAPSQLERVYRLIEQDLRSQYLLVYRPEAGKPRTEFRTVTVEVSRVGLKARTIHGYYP